MAQDIDGSRVGYTVDEIAGQTGASVVGDGSLKITGVNSIDAACKTEITFATSADAQARAIESQAGAVLVKQAEEGASITQLVVDNVEETLIAVLKMFATDLTVTKGVHPTAIIDESASVGDGASIGPWVHIGPNAKVGNSVISARCTIGAGSVVGENTRLDENVIVYHNCTIGNNCIIQANSTIGGTGFGYYPVNNVPTLIPHNGGVIIEDCVEIGSNCCVDRAKFGNTVIGAGTKIDNQVQIAHNVIIGRCCLIAAQVGISGSVNVGNGVIIAGQVGVSDHKKICDGAIIGGGSAVVDTIKPGQKVWGSPAIDASLRMRVSIAQKKLPEMVKTLKDVVRRVERLEDNKAVD